MTLDRLSHSLGQLVTVVIVGNDRGACISLAIAWKMPPGTSSRSLRATATGCSRMRFREASLAAVSASAVSRDLTPDLTPKVSA